MGVTRPVVITLKITHSESKLPPSIGRVWPYGTLGLPDGTRLAAHYGLPQRSAES